MSQHAEYKDSGIPWIGDIPAHWEIVRLQTQLDEVNEKNDPVQTTQILSLTNKLGVIPYEEKGNQGNKSKEDLTAYKIAYPDCIVANSMNILIGSVGLSKYYGCVSPVYYVFRAKNAANIDYINYLFSLPSFQRELRKYANGILEIRLRVSSSNILKQKIALPPVDEQRKIVEYLKSEIDRIDSVIAEAKASIEEYKAWKASIIYEAVTKGLDPTVEMKDSGIEWIGTVPATWQLIRLKFLMEAIVDCPHETPEYSNDGSYYVIRTADQDPGYLRPDENMYRLDENEYIKRIRRLPLAKDDIVYGREGERWGLACIVPASNKYCLGQRMMQFRCNTSIFLPEFARWALNSYGVYMQGTVDTIGSTSPHVNISTLRDYQIPIPSIVEQERIAKYITERCDKIINLIAEKELLITDLETYKKALIFEVVTGKRRVC